MFGIGWTEFVIIALGILIFVGPRNLPKLLQKMGALLSEVKSAGRELNNQIADEVRDIEKEIGTIRSPSRAVRSAAKDWVNTLPSPRKKIKEIEKSAQKRVNDVKIEIIDVKKEEPDVPKKQVDDNLNNSEEEIPERKIEKVIAR